MPILPEDIGGDPIDSGGRDGGGGIGGWPPGGGGVGTGGDPPTTGPLTGPAGIVPFNPAGFFPTLPIIGGIGSEQAEAILRMIAASSAFMDSAQRNALFSALLPALLPYLQGGGEGFRPDALAAMRAEAIESTSRATRGAKSSLMTELSRRGLRTGSAPIAGEGLRRIAEIDTAGGIETARALRGVTTQNEQQRLQNLFNSFNIASGHPTNVAGNVNAGSQVPEERPGLGSTLVSSLAGGAASAAGQALGNSLGNLLSQIPIFRTPNTFPCAIAIELYGENDIRTIIIRLWLVLCVDSVMGRALVNLYSRYGQAWAKIVRGNLAARYVARKLFDRLFVMATR